MLHDAQARMRQGRLRPGGVDSGTRAGASTREWRASVHGHSRNGRGGHGLVQQRRACRGSSIIRARAWCPPPPRGAVASCAAAPRACPRN
eukprot:scaffold4518_cov410-Prasinococcus_capsulatus_cf.AAC.28